MKWSVRPPFLLMWTLAVASTTAAFSVHVAIRVKTMQLGYELGREHAHIGRLREVKRVLELEVASQKTPERVDLVARTLLGMSEPSSDRILSLGKMPDAPDMEEDWVHEVASTKGERR